MNHTLSQPCKSAGSSSGNCLCKLHQYAWGFSRRRYTIWMWNKTTFMSIDILSIEACPQQLLPRCRATTHLISELRTVWFDVWTYCNMLWILRRWFITVLKCISNRSTYKYINDYNIIQNNVFVRVIHANRKSPKNDKRCSMYNK